MTARNAGISRLNLKYILNSHGHNHRGHHCFLIFIVFISLWCIVDVFIFVGQDFILSLKTLANVPGVIILKVMSYLRSNVNMKTKSNFGKPERRSPRPTKTPSINELKNKYSKYTKTLICVHLISTIHYFCVIVHMSQHI